MSDEKSNESRRKLLKSIAAGSGAIVAGNNLPESWSRPVVDGVMLPVHAQTSPFQGSYHFQNIRQASLSTESDSMFASLVEATVPEANAQAAPPFIDDYCVDVFNDGSWRAAIRVTQDGNLVAIWWTATDGTVGGPAVTMNERLCGIEHPPITFQVTSGSASQVNVVIMEGSSQNPVTMILAGNCPFGDPNNELCPMAESDRNIKENFVAVDEQEILNKVANLPIEMWNYTDRDHGVRHIGPMAQDFMKAFNVGDSDRHIHMVDANGVNMAAIKALNAKLEEKDEQIQDLQDKLEKVMLTLDKLS
jgi:hypothetical protein